MDEFANLNAAYVKDRKVCATGRLVSMTHDELAKLVRGCGGDFLRSPRRSSFILVVGDGGWPSERDGSLNQVFDRARRLKAYGYSIDFIAEEDFLERLGLRQSAGAIRGRHTLSDLSRLLGISSVRLRCWMRAGLISPVVTQFQLPFFDFHQVAFVKQLQELLEQGASLANIRRGIEQVQDLLPHGDSLSTLFANIERDGRVLIRQRDHLVDHTGQKYFDFEATGDNDPTLFASAVQSGFHDLCDEALALEDEGRLDEAAETYERALELEPDHPTLHYDLGNVLFQLGQSEASIGRFREALRFDPEFAMAWHNLGCVYAHLSAWDHAEPSLRRALELVPTYADSHFTLAEVLRRQGKRGEAEKHQLASVELSSAECLVSTRQSLLRVVRCEDGADDSSP